MGEDERVKVMRVLFRFSLPLHPSVDVKLVVRYTSLEFGDKMLARFGSWCFNSWFLSSLHPHWTDGSEFLSHIQPRAQKKLLTQGQKFILPKNYLKDALQWLTSLGGFDWDSILAVICTFLPRMFAWHYKKSTSSSMEDCGCSLKSSFVQS